MSPRVPRTPKSKTLQNNLEVPEVKSEPDEISLKCEPEVDEVRSEPNIVKSELETDTVKTEVEPDVVKSELEPGTVKTEFEPDVVKSEPEISTNTRSLRPRVVKSEPEPDTAVKKEPKINTNSRVLRPRQKKNFTNLDDGKDIDDSFQLEEIESNSDSDSESELFARKKKKRKLNDGDQEFVKILQNADLNEDEENEYRLQRQRNLQDRFKVLSELEFGSDIQELKAAVPQNKVTPKRPLKSRKQVPKVQPTVTPRKRSLRLMNRSLNTTAVDSSIEPDSQFGSVKLEEESLEPSRITDENLQLVDDGAEEDLLKALENLKTDLSIPFEPDSDFNTCDFDKFSEIVKTCQMKDPPIKAIHSRISALDIHPSQKKLILIMGDKSGNLSIRDVTKDNGVECRPHSRNTNCVSFSAQDSTKFFSTSLDGTVRQGDVNSSNLQLVYNATDDEHTTWHHEFGHSLFVAEGAGTVKLIDLRAGADDSATFYCHPRSVRTVQLHPTDENYFLTGSGYGEFAIWDIRNANRKKNDPVILQNFDKALTSAFFSAQGNYVLATCNDDTVRVFDVKGLQKSTQNTVVNHNNHTGRWLSVFKAKWQPQREDAFFIGSMMTNPRRLQIYQRNGKMLHQLISPELATICPLIAAHSTLPIYVGGNSSGRLHVFSPYSSLSEIFS